MKNILKVLVVVAFTGFLISGCGKPSVQNHSMTELNDFKTMSAQNAEANMLATRDQDKLLKGAIVQCRRDTDISKETPFGDGTSTCEVTQDHMVTPWKCSTLFKRICVPETIATQRPEYKNREKETMTMYHESHGDFPVVKW